MGTSKRLRGRAELDHAHPNPQSQAVIPAVSYIIPHILWATRAIRCGLCRRYCLRSAAEALKACPFCQKPYKYMVELEREVSFGSDGQQAEVALRIGGRFA